MRYFPQFFLIKKPEKGLHNPEIGFRVQSSQHTTKPQTSNDGACRLGWQGQNTGPSLAAVEKYQTNERGSSMTKDRLSVIAYAAVCVAATVIWIHVLFQIAQLVIR